MLLTVPVIDHTEEPWGCIDPHLLSYLLHLMSHKIPDLHKISLHFSGIHPLVSSLVTPALTDHCPAASVTLLPMGLPYCNMWVWFRPPPVFFDSSGAKNVFIFKWLENIKRTIIFPNMWKWYAIQISVPINKVYGNRATLIHYILSVAASMWRWQSWVFATETVCPGRPEIFTVWS